MLDTDYQTLSGIKKADFEDIHIHIAAKIQNTQNRGTRMSLGTFLLKMRSGISNQSLSTIFGFSKSSICRAIGTVRSTLMKSFVPQNIGLQHISRQELIDAFQLYT